MIKFIEECSSDIQLPDVCNKSRVEVSLLEDGLGIEQVIDGFRRFLLAIGYHTDTIEKYLGEE